MKLNRTAQSIIPALQQASHMAQAGSWQVVQQICRQVLEAIAVAEPGVIQYEKSIGGYRIRVHHQAGYDTWGFHFRWLSDAAEYVALLNEIGFEWENEEMSDQFIIDVLEEEKNDEIQIEKAEWLERMSQW